MIDGRGLPRLMDFGLAASAGRVASNEIRQGTPAYMAPEQLAGKEVTVQSDLYALGLILYELYTGKRPFEASSLEQFLVLRERNAAPEPSTLCPDLDTSTERIILECLSPDPARRPASAAAIAARLPYKDALSAVLAVGDTPSPDLVAASGDSVAIRPRVAWIWAAAVLIGLAAGIVLRASHAKSVPDQPPEVLANNARILAGQIGYTGTPAATAYGFLQDGLLKFWYRESNAPLEAAALPDVRYAPGRVTPDDPPMAPGMLSIETDAHGRLAKFFAVPDSPPVPGESEKPADWNPFFAAAELDLSHFSPNSAPALPQIAADSTLAWTGTRTSGARSENGGQLRVISASVHGRVVYFEVTPDTPSSESADLLRLRSRMSAIGGILLAILVPVIFFLAYRNIRQRRIDRKGAFLVAAAMFWICVAQWIVISRHSVTPHQLTVGSWALCWALGNAALAWICFVAAEPNLRRLAPGILVSVQKVLTGAKRDAQVGRDLIWGMLIAASASFAGVAMGGTPNGPTGFTLRGLAGLWLGDLRIGLFIGLLAMLLIIPIAFRFRKKARYGVLSVIVAETGIFALRDLPPITDFSSWSAQAPVIGYVLLAAFTLYSARLATGAGSLTAVQASIAERVAAQ